LLLLAPLLLSLSLSLVFPVLREEEEETKKRRSEQRVQRSGRSEAKNLKKKLTSGLSMR